MHGIFHESQAQILPVCGYSRLKAGPQVVEAPKGEKLPWPWANIAEAGCVEVEECQNTGLIPQTNMPSIRQQ